MSGAYASFLIRLWCEPGEDACKSRTAWRAEVEHIQSGTLSDFDNIDQALSFVRQQTTGRAPPGQEPVTPTDADPDDTIGEDTWTSSSQDGE